MDGAILNGKRSHKTQYESTMEAVEISKAPLKDEIFIYYVKIETYHAFDPDENVRLISSNTFRYYTDELDVEDFTDEIEALKHKVNNLLGTVTWS